MFSLPTVLPSKILNLCFLLCDVGRESGNFKYATQMEKFGTYEIEKSEQVRKKSEQLPLPFLPTLPAGAQTTMICLPRICCN